MPERIFIDTLFVVALLNPRDQHYQQARDLSDQCEGRHFLTTDAVLLEIGNALARRYKSQAIEVIDQFLSSADVEVVRMTPELFAEAYSLYKSHRDKEWGLSDCLSIVVMTRAGVTDALTFDQHFVQAGFQALMRAER